MDIRKGKRWFHPFQSFKLNSTVLLLGVAIIFCIVAFNQFRLSQFFPIKNVRIYGADRSDHQEIQTLLTPLVDHGFFNVGIDFIRDRLLQLPWISDVFVRRNWPDTVEITIIEKKAVARWNQQGLLSENGEIFSPKIETYPSLLPKFIGPTGQQMLMLQYFIEMNRLLLPLRAKISSLELSSYSTWKMTLDNGVALEMGHQHILTRLYHFVKVYPKVIGNRAIDVDYIDLRYSNGMAVQWKTPIKT